jgi:F-type H+-transporting ATPase subunit b
MSFGSLTLAALGAGANALDSNLVLARAPVEVDLDLTVIGQMVLFVVLMLVLKPLLFDPMLKLFEEREKRIDGAKLEARKIDQQSTGALSKYESAMAKARGEANAERDKLRAEGTKIENDILSRVRGESAKTLDEGRKRMSAERLALEESLGREVRALARDLAGTTLGREVGG